MFSDFSVGVQLLIVSLFEYFCTVLFFIKSKIFSFKYLLNTLIDLVGFGWLIDWSFVRSSFKVMVVCFCSRSLKSVFFIWFRLSLFCSEMFSFLFLSWFLLSDFYNFFCVVVSFHRLNGVIRVPVTIKFLVGFSSTCTQLCVSAFFTLCSFHAFY